MALNVHTYLSFDGNCEEAFDFYKSVFGGEYAFLGRFKDMPDQKIDEADLNKIMHVYLPIGEHSAIMGSDVPNSLYKVQAGNNFSISVNLDCAGEGKRVFDALSAGGNVVMPFEKAFWGDMYGMLTDKFGINWMVNCALEKK